MGMSCGQVHEVNFVVNNDVTTTRQHSVRMSEKKCDSGAKKVPIVSQIHVV